MKRSVLIALAGLLAVAPSTQAQFVEQYSFSLGLGGSSPLGPDEFNDNYNNGFGLMLDVGARRNMVEAALSLNYNFYFIETGNSLTPDDLNLAQVFLELKIKPLDSSFRPYLLVGGGLFRYWIVNSGRSETVLGYTGGGGVEADIGKRQQLFFEVKYIAGQTRETVDKANTETLDGRFGVAWIWK